MSFMLQPVTRTLVAGAQSLAAVTHSGGIGATLSRMSQSLSRGDLFVWVGLFRLVPEGERALRTLAANGVHTVFYSTDAADMAAGAPGWACKLNNRLSVQEIWEYSHATIDFCRAHTLGHLTRLVPPGFLPPPVHPAHLRKKVKPPQQLVLLAAITYAPRIACVHALNASLAAHAPAVQLLQFNDAWSDEALTECTQQHSFFVNLHKECHLEVSCETLRFAQLLNAGAAAVLSDRCHPQDELDWAGLVTFANRSALPAAFLKVARQSDTAEADKLNSDRSSLFEREFSPVAIFKRAGIAALFARLAASTKLTQTQLGTCVGAAANSALPLSRAGPASSAPGCHSGSFAYHERPNLRHRHQRSSPAG